MKSVQIIGGLLAWVLSLSAFAQAGVEAKLAEKLQAVIPDAEVTSVKPGPIPGLFEVMLGATVLYMTEDGQFAFRGDVFDLKSKKNLTNARRKEARTAAFAAQAKNAIEFAPTTAPATHLLYVFTDMDCGYCRKMHQEVSKLNAAGITVRYLAFPRTGLNTDSYFKSVSVWCAADRKAALTAAKAGQEIEKKTCDNPVKSQYEMGQAFGVHGTPAVYLENGEEIGGYIPAADLIRMFQTGEI